MKKPSLVTINYLLTSSMTPLIAAKRKKKYIYFLLHSDTVLVLVEQLTQFAEAGKRPSKAEYLLEKNIISVI
jgi:hypothetical protein